MSEHTEDSRDRRQRILDGARSAFLRFGFARASLADIAAGSGVSRTALYHYFPSKDEILQALVENLNAFVMTTATEALENSSCLDDALTNLLLAKFGRTHALISESPHGIELVESTHRLAGAAMGAADSAFHALVVKALKKYDRSVGAEATADTLIASAKGLMRSGDVHVSTTKFEKRIRLLVSWVVK